LSANSASAGLAQAAGSARIVGLYEHTLFYLEPIYSFTEGANPPNYFMAQNKRIWNLSMPQKNGNVRPTDAGIFRPDQDLTPRRLWRSGFSNHQILRALQ
jgi:hypothetical protein